MRVTNAVSYNEPRDAISKDWYRYLQEVLPNTNWIILPNLGEDIVDYVKKWQINAFIFSGGESLGESESRDLTEISLFNYAQETQAPILGICRGFQAIYTFLGGVVEKQNELFSKTHRATRHKIIVKDVQKEVNSYHNNQALIDTKPKGVKVLATCLNDGSLEAFTAPNILALLWHPERETEFQKWDAQLIKTFFCCE